MWRVVGITPATAKAKAIEQAKAQALQIAGVDQIVRVFDSYDKKEDREAFEEYFFSLTQVESQGSVTQYELINENMYVDDVTKDIIVEVEIDARVKKYKSITDPSFSCEIAGLKPAYKNEEPLRFSVKPNKTGYLQVFIMDEANNMFLLFPNDSEKANLLNEKTVTRFPMVPYHDYITWTEKEEEVNYVLFLFSKKDVPYKGGQHSHFDQYVKHAFTIEPADRFLTMEKITIYK